MDIAQGLKLTIDTSEMLEMSGLVRTKPTSKTVNEDFVLKTIIHFFDKVNLDTDEDLDTIIHDLTYTETWQEIFKIINIGTKLSTIIKNLFIKDFTINDIINPGTKRINKCLRYLSNFLIYYTSKISDMDNHFSEFSDKQNMITNLIHETQTYEKKILNAINKKEAMLKENEKLLLQIEEQNVKLSKQNEQKIVLQKNINEAKKRHEKNKQIIGNHKADFLEFQQYKNNLEKKFVKSPRKIDNKLNTLCSIKEEKIKEISNLKEHILETNKIIEIKKKMCESMEELLNKCLECSEVKKQYLLSVENAVDLGKQLNKMENQIEEAKKVQVDDNNKKVYENEHLENLKREYDENIKDLLAQQSILRNECMNSEKLLQTSLTKKEDIERKKQILNKITAELLKENEQFINDCNELFQTQINSIIKNHDEIEKILDNK